MMLIDAFTDRPLGGNPCAVVFEADAMDRDTRQAVALEMNLSETAFVFKSEHADFGVRYFTPAEEIPMAGHPTIATAFALVSSGRLPLKGVLTTVHFELAVGPIRVDIEAEAGQVRRITMSQMRPQFLATLLPERVLPVFGLSAEDQLPGAPIQVVSTGTPILMVPLRDHASLRRARLDSAAYEVLRHEASFFSPHLFCLEGATSEGQTFARHFGVPPDTGEDSFTGSATGAMGAYLWHHGLLETPIFIAEQGHWLKRPGRGYVEVVGPRHAIETVKVGGAAVRVMEGTLYL